MVPRKNGHHFADDIFKHILLYGIAVFWFKFSDVKGPTDKPAVVQIMACHQTGNKPLSYQWGLSLLMNILGLAELIDVCDG